MVRNNANQLVSNQQVGMQISILQGSVEGRMVYTETHTLTTGEKGLASIEIGAGNKSLWPLGIEDINWANGPYFLKTDIDPAGGATYTITGTSQILSVPYALHVKTAEKITGSINEYDPDFYSSVAREINQDDINKWNNKQDKLLAGKGIVISGNEISLNPLVQEGDKSGGIAQYYKNDENIETDPDVLLFTNFEKSNWGTDWNTSGTHPLITSNEKEKFVPFDGRALQVTVPEGKNSGLSITYRFKEKTGSEPEEIFFRYYLRIGDGWAPSFSGKFQIGRAHV